MRNPLTGDCHTILMLLIIAHISEVHHIQILVATATILVTVSLGVKAVAWALKDDELDELYDDEI